MSEGQKFLGPALTEGEHKVIRIDGEVFEYLQLLSGMIEKPFATPNDILRVALFEDQAARPPRLKVTRCPTCGKMQKPPLLAQPKGPLP